MPTIWEESLPAIAIRTSPQCCAYFIKVHILVTNLSCATGCSESILATSKQICCFPTSFSKCYGCMVAAVICLIKNPQIYAPGLRYTALKSKVHGSLTATQSHQSLEAISRMTRKITGARIYHYEAASSLKIG